MCWLDPGLKKSIGPKRTRTLKKRDVKLGVYLTGRTFDYMYEVFDLVFTTTYACKHTYIHTHTSEGQKSDDFLSAPIMYLAGIATEEL